MYFLYSIYFTEAYLQRGNTDKVMMFASQTLLVCFHDNFILEIACIELNTGCWWSSLAAGGLQDGLPKGILEIAQFLLFFVFKISFLHAILAA